MLKLLLSLFKSSKERFSPTPNQNQRDLYYEMIVSRFLFNEEIDRIVIECQANITIKHNVEIDTLFDAAIGSLTRKAVLKILGQPRYSKKILYKGKKAEILVYKINKFKKRAKLALLLVEDNLLFYSYMFSLLNKEEKINISKLFADKTLQDPSYDYLERCIEDKNGFRITFNDEALFYVNIFDKTLVKTVQEYNPF
jgi:hypothetical protein